jgi:UDP-N-acetyl-D-glucosamine dehydrogenase
MREHSFDLSSVEITPSSLREFDAVLLLTDHSAFDYEMVLEHANLIVDTRGRFRAFGPSDKLIQG